MEELTQIIDENGQEVLSNIYTDENGKYELRGRLVTATTKIEKLNLNMKKSLLAIAKTLSEIKKVDLKKCGFKSTAHYANVVFGYSKSMVSQLIKVGEQYVVREGQKYFTILEDEETGVDFTASQIQECLRLDVATVQELVENKTITPDMTCKEIRGIVKELVDDKKESQEEISETGESNETEELSKYFDVDKFFNEFRALKVQCDNIMRKECGIEDFRESAKKMTKIVENMNKYIN